MFYLQIYFFHKTDAAKAENNQDDKIGATSNNNDENYDSGSESDDEAIARDDTEGTGKHFRRHRSVEFQRHHSVTEAEHSLLF